MNQIIKNQNKKGFTLIELIVVIVIIGILAAIVIPRLTGFTETAKVSADKATYEIVNTGIAIAVTEGKIISTVTLATDANGVGTFSGQTSCAAIMATYVQSAPTFKLTDNASKTFEWVVSAGIVTAPVITNGVVTP
jgi:type IV pilus assembly protein PilA